jgi:ABC-type multidrug transport system ATPase subunit
MVAILGPSGSGKTTLLNFISSRSNWDKKLYVDGELYLNNFQVKHLSKYKHLIGFVPQEDIIFENLTVRQNLETYGCLRGFPNYKEKATKLIQELGLEKCQDTMIGNQEERGVSGGERKRTCIGVELMSDPKMLFLDEPTTGIDAYTALEVMKNLRKLNQEKGIGICTVIHQPRQEIINNFDRVRLR